MYVRVADGSRCASSSLKSNLKPNVFSSEVLVGERGERVDLVGLMSRSGLSSRWVTFQSQDACMSYVPAEVASHST